MTELNIVDVIGRRVELEVHGNGRYWGICPFHVSQKEIDSHNIITPSIIVDRDEETFRCLKCDEKGSAQDFLDKFNNLGKDSL